MVKSKRRYLTLAILRSNKACKPRYDYLTEKLGSDFRDDEPLTLTRILEINGASDCLWAFGCFEAKYNEELKIIAMTIAVWSACQVLKYFERELQSNYGPLKAIEATKAYLENPSDNAARAAAYIAYSLTKYDACTSSNAVRAFSDIAYAVGTAAYGAIDAAAEAGIKASKSIVAAAHAIDGVNIDIRQAIADKLKTLLMEKGW